MKIVGFTYYEGQYRMTMKSDSSLLNQDKPFFLPDWSYDVRACRCVAVRVCRQGRSVETRFASRYYDAMACGIDFRASDLLREGRIVEALAFDGALCVGGWLQPDQFRLLSDTPLAETEQVFTIGQAIAQISRVMTVRMGDILYIDMPCEAQPVHREDVFQYGNNGLNLLYCRIK